MIGWLATVCTLLGMLFLAVGPPVLGWLVCITGNALWLCHAYDRDDIALAVVNVVLLVIGFVGCVRSILP